ncbi:protein kinase family protein [Mesorhizobium sp. B2-8-9]|uniref:protein kinase family protein n=1 Tax=Mesorhizobium sp. B2-8-9 TaxID=2589899 RepID=UPI0015E2EB5F|nr:protein kinase family protein [Mesorhizobium sp. B2-8-9]
MAIVQIGTMVDSEGHPIGHGRVALKSFAERFFFDLQISTALRQEIAIWTRLAEVPFVFPVMSIIEIDQKPAIMMPEATRLPDGSSSLEDRIRIARAGLSPKDCLLAALSTALALVGCSQVIPNIVHGDIKPANLLLLGEIFYLADFGLSAIDNQAGPAGTPSYMAPELWAGSPRSTKSDLYAFGATVFAALNGKPPFSLQTTDPNAWLSLHGQDAPHFSALGPLGSLASELETVALGCISRKAEDRPTDFGEVFARLLALGLTFEPAATTHLMDVASGLRKFAVESKLELLELRIPPLLEQGHHRAALELLQSISESELSKDLLLIAGTTYSLNEDDEHAISLFEQYLATDPASPDRIRCLSEYGLSLRRLGRLAEARDIFEKLLTEADGDQTGLIRGNLAGTLIDLGEVERAEGELHWLTLNRPENAIANAMMAEVKRRLGKTDEAETAILRAIRLKPNSGQYRAILGEILLVDRKDPDAAIEALDRAFELGFQSIELLVNLTAANMVLGNQGHVGVLLAKLGEAPKELADSSTKKILGIVRSILGIAVSDPSETPEKEPEDGSAKSESESSNTREAETVSTLRETRSVEQHRKKLAEGLTSQIQARISMVEGAYTVDFYSRPEREEFVVEFCDGYRHLVRKFEGQFPTFIARKGGYRFANCERCGFSILTARDEFETISCQVCEHRGKVVTFRSPILDRLLAGCLEGVGLTVSETATEPYTTFLGLWFSDGVDPGVSSYLSEAGCKQLGSKTAAYEVFRQKHQERTTLELGSPTQVWACLMPSDEPNPGKDTPLFVEKILRDLRREHGNFRSMTITVPEGNWQDIFLGTMDDLLERLKSQSQTAHDPQLELALIQAAIQAGQIDAAKRRLAGLEILDPNGVETLTAQAAVANHLGDHRLAAKRAEEALRLAPRHVEARVLAIEAYSRLSDTELARKHRDILISHGHLKAGGNTNAS